MKKRISALVLILVLMLNVMVVAGPTVVATTVNELSENTTDVVAYVSQGTETTGAIGDEANPYPTISAAITALDAVVGEDINRVVKVTGAYVCLDANEAFKSSNWYGFAKHTNHITIESTTPDSQDTYLDLSGLCTVGGPTTIDNIYYLQTSNSKEIRADGHELTFGPNAVSHPNDKIGYIYTGAYSPGLGTTSKVGIPAGTGKQKLTVNGQTFSLIGLGDSNPYHASGKAYNIAGIDFVMNGGRTVNFISIGSYKYNCYNYFTDNVNVTINSGTVPQYRLLTPTETSIFAEGKGLQIILNNGTAFTKWYYDSANQTSAPSLKDANGNDCLYLIQSASASNGAALKATDKLGVYTLVNAGAYTAVAKDANGNEYRSVDGTLTLGAGVYNVTWVKEIAGSTIYVDLANGNDELATGSKSAPFKTMNAAITALDAYNTSDERVIKVIGTYEINDAEKQSAGNYAFAKHTNPITIAAEDSSSILFFAAGKTIRGIGGPLTIDLPYYFPNANMELCAFGYELTFGENAVCTTGWGTWGNVATGQYANLYAAEMNDRTVAHKLTVKNGKFTNIYVGHSPVIANQSNKVAGAKILLEGGQSAKVMIGANANQHFGKTIYTKDINITVNGGSFKQFKFTSANGYTVDALHSFQDGAALQILFNHGLGSTVTTMLSVEDVATAGGKLFVLKSAKEEGSYLELTDTSGVYKVYGGKTAIAINEADTSKIYYSENGTLVLTEPGIYSVNYRDDYALINDEIIFFKDTQVTLSELPYKKLENKLFVGWTCGTAVAADGLYTAGQTLVPAYIDFDVTSDLFAVESVLHTAEKALRYIFQFSHNIKNNTTITDVKFGAVVLPNIMLKGQDLELNKEYYYNGNPYASADIPAEKLYMVNNAEGWTQYTACLYNFPLAKYTTDYAARGYMIYTDMNGVQRVVYTDKTKDNLYDAAQRLLEVEPMNEIANEIITDGEENEKTTVNNIVTWGDSITEGFGASNLQNNSYPGQLQQLISAANKDFNVINSGGSGEKSVAIMSRQGAEEAYTQSEFFFAEGVTSIVLCSLDTSGRMTAGFVNKDGILMNYMCVLGNELSINDLVIDGNEYAIVAPDSSNGYKYLLTRKDATNAVTIPAGSPVTFASESSAKSNYCDIYYMGANDGTYDDAADLVAKYQKMIDYRNDDCYIIIIPYWTNQFDAAFKEAFGDHAINFREFAIEYGYAPYVDDINGVALLNPNLNKDNNKNDVHLNDDGYALLARAIYLRGQQLGYWD